MQNQETEAKANEEVSEEVKTEETTTAPEPEQQTQDLAPRTDEVIDVEWGEVEQLFRVNTYSKQLESQLAEMCLRHEKMKQNLLSRISECETFMFNSGTSLKDSCNIDPNLTYELKLPNQEGEKAFFLRKDA